MRYWDEMVFWVFLAIALTLFTTAMRGLLPIAAGKLPLPDGLREVLAK